MYCTKCNKEYHDKMKFCVICGNELSLSAESYMTEPVTTVTEPVTVVTEPAPYTAPVTPVIPEPVAPVIEEYHSAAENQTPVDSIIPDEISGENAETVEIPVTRKRHKAFRNAGVGIFSVLFSIIGFAFIFTAGVSFLARVITYPETAEAVTASVDIMDLPIEDLGVSAIGDFDTVGQAIKTIAESAGVEVDIEEIYENSTIKAEITKFLEENTEYLRTGTIPPDLNAERIKAIFNDNLDVIEKVYGRPLRPTEIETAMEQIDSVSAEIEGINMRNLQSEFDFNIIRLAVSTPVIVTELVFALLIFIFIGFANRFASPALAGAGVSVIISGTLIGLSTFIMSNNLAVFPIPEMFTDLSASLFGAISMAAYITAGAGIFAGIILVVLSKLKVFKSTQMSEVR